MPTHTCLRYIATGQVSCILLALVCILRTAFCMHVPQCRVVFAACLRAVLCMFERIKNGYTGLRVCGCRHKYCSFHQKSAVLGVLL